MLFIITAQCAGFLFVAFATHDWMAITGVVLTSINLGLHLVIPYMIAILQECVNKNSTSVFYQWIATSKSKHQKCIMACLCGGLLLKSWNRIFILRHTFNFDINFTGLGEATFLPYASRFHKWVNNFYCVIWNNRIQFENIFFFIFNPKIKEMSYQLGLPELVEREC